MLEPMLEPVKRPRRTIVYGPPLECLVLINAAEQILQPASGHREFPVTDEMRAAAVATIAAACRAVIVHTERWGTPETDGLSTWACVAFAHRGHAEAVLNVVTRPALNFRALRRALNAWRRYGL